jgi:hypothetical protein
MCADLGEIEIGSISVNLSQVQSGTAGCCEIDGPALQMEPGVAWFFAATKSCFTR